FNLHVRSSSPSPPPRHSPARACGMSMAQPISPSSSDQINRARPGLVAVALRHAHIDRKIGAARERHDVIDDEAPAPILLGHLNMGRRARSPCAILLWLEALERPVNTPEIVNKLNNEITAALADPQLKARLADLGGTVIAGSPAEFGKLIADETEKWGKVIWAANIKPE